MEGTGTEEHVQRKKKGKEAAVAGPSQEEHSRVVELGCGERVKGDIQKGFASLGPRDRHVSHRRQRHLQSEGNQRETRVTDLLGAASARGGALLPRTSTPYPTSPSTLSQSIVPSHTRPREEEEEVFSQRHSANSLYCFYASRIE